MGGNRAGNSEDMDLGESQQAGWGARRCRTFHALCFLTWHRLVLNKWVSILGTPTLAQHLKKHYHQSSLRGTHWHQLLSHNPVSHICKAQMKWKAIEKWSRPGRRGCLYCEHRVLFRTPLTLKRPERLAKLDVARAACIKWVLQMAADVEKSTVYNNRIAQAGWHGVQGSLAKGNC